MGHTIFIKQSNRTFSKTPCILYLGESYCEGSDPIENCDDVVTSIVPLGINMIGLLMKNYHGKISFDTGDLCVDILQDNVLNDPCNQLC